MDGKHFDAFTRSFATGRSRRGVLRTGLALAGAALGLGRLAGAEAAANKRPAGSICTTDANCASGLCGPKDRSGRRRCQCVDVTDCPASDNSCVEVSCAAGVCQQSVTVGAECSSGNFCLTGETCQANGVCGAGTPVNCDDSNACTIDTCDPAIGCVHRAKECPAPTELCKLATCDPQTGECGVENNTCNDGYSCTKDSCNPTNGECVNTYVVSDKCPPRVACTSTSDCTASSNPCAVTVCVAGWCQPEFLSTGDSCSSGDPCLTEETCQANGECGGGVAGDC